ncbi:cell death abnormality protein 1-like [Ostrea edulis]|uniref:cell death abnormality protein 1-like n=1 Tax=Ostrea edulis TaxID=37623 RepID=UPI0024AEFCDC|nr:cell death abnormality protein 1-like [Ostrea edulis]
MFPNDVVLICYFVAIFSGKANSYGCSRGTITEEEPECCYNFYRVNNFCKQCLPGFYGHNCVRVCRYPYYGQHCMYMCRCPESECNHQYGCEPSTSSAYTDLLDIHKLLPLHRFNTLRYQHVSKTDARASWVQHPKSALPKTTKLMEELFPAPPKYQR